MKKRRKLSMILTMALAASMVFAGTAFASESGETPEDEGDVVISDAFTVTDNMYCDTLTIEEGAIIEPEDGYSLVMIADGEVVKPEPGDYTDVCLILQDADYDYGAYDETGNEEGYAYRFLFNNDFIVSEAFDDAVTLSEEDGYAILNGEGSTLTVNDDGINAISVEDSDMIIENFDISVIGNGICEYGNAFGAAISVAGDSNVIIRDVDVTTQGPIMSALNSTDGNVLVISSQFNGYGGSYDDSGVHSGIDAYSNIQGALTEVPWVLGMKGSLRTTNVIGDANVLYYDCSGSSNGWGVYSTDGGSTLIMIDSEAYYDDSLGAEFESIYGSYVLSLPCYYYGFNVDFSNAEENAYGIVARSSFTLAESSQENLNALDEVIGEVEEPAEEEEPSEEDDAEPEGGQRQQSTIQDAAGVWQMFKDEVGISNVEDRRSSITAKYGIMSHGTSGDLFDITGTDITASTAAFLMKGAYSAISLDGTDTIDAPIIILEQLPDDAGIGEAAYDGAWAESTTPFLYEIEDTGVVPEQGVDATMTDMELEGDFYNTDTTGAYLNLEFSGTEVTGTISSGTYLHDNVSYYLVENPDFDASEEESAENMKYLCCDAEGNAYESTLTFAMFGMNLNYHPVYTDDNGIVTFAYDESGTVYDPSEIVGYCIFYNDAQYCSNGTITPCESINDPTYVTLSDNSVWNVTGEGYIDSLEVEEGSVINGTVTVDGSEVDTSAGGSWSGNIVVTP